MADETGISWAHSTFNPWMGCARVSPACARCYAETLTKNRMGLDVWGDSPRKVTAASTWAKPVKWNREAAAFLAEFGCRRRVFCASLADVFEDLPSLEEPRERLFRLIAETPELDWLLLTKRPEFARDWLRSYYETPVGALRSGARFRFEGAENWTWRDGIGWGVLPNVWVGVSVENQRWTWRADVLREIPTVVRFISAEPLLTSLLSGPTSGESPDAGDTSRQPDEGSIPSGSITESRPTAPSLGDALEGSAARPRRAPLDLNGIDWLIVGGESGSREARPMHPSWVLELRDDAVERGIAFHMKQWGAWTPSSYDGDFVLPNGDRVSSLAADAYGVELSGAYRMKFAGVSPKAGGKLLEGRDWCEIPEPGAVLA